jgi:large-conductance mechanosensitive channel
MSALIHEIQAIRSLRKNVRNQPLSDAVMKAMEMIHQSIAGSSDAPSSSSKKSEWRSNHHASSSASSSQSSNFRGNNVSHPSPSNNGSRNGFFGNSRNHSNNVNAFTDASRRFRSAAPQPPQKEAVVSVPLEQHAGEDIADKKDEDGFEVVRRPNRTGGGNGRKNDHSVAATAAASSEPQTAIFRSAPPQKYVSRFRKESDQVEDIILNKILLGKLNKFSAKNYAEIKEFITHIIDSGETEMIKCFMKLVFEKAASEEMFCPLYARLLSELSAKYPILLEEMKNLYVQYMEIFEEVPANASDESYQELCQRNVEKKYRRGYSQFLAELIKYNVISTDVFMCVVNTIIHQVELNLTNKESVKLIEEYADCLMKIVKAIKTKSLPAQAKDGSDSDTESGEIHSEELMTEIRRILRESYIDRIQPLTVRQAENVGLSNKARFTFLDIFEAIQRFTI